MQILQIVSPGIWVVTLEVVRSHADHVVGGDYGGSESHHELIRLVSVQFIRANN